LGKTKIERKPPSVGTVLEGHRNNKKYSATIVSAPDFPDRKAVKIGNVLYKSMSAAEKALTKQSTNGWVFWKIVK
jgi:hypothetical protein